MTEAATKGFPRNFTKFTRKHLCQSLFFSNVAGLRPATLLKKRLWHKCFPVNFAKFLRASFLQNTSGRLFMKWNKTKCLPLLITFSSLSDINTTLKIGMTVTWSFILRYVIAITSLWCWKKISYNDVTTISKRNRSISGCKSNEKKMRPQYRVPTGTWYFRNPGIFRIQNHNCMPTHIDNPVIFTKIYKYSELWRI